MCGRCRCTLRSDDVPRACHLRDSSVRNVDLDRYRPSYNVSPGSYLPVLRRDSGTDGCNFAVHCMKWGLVPSFTKKDEKPDHFKMFNARSESVCEKAAFRRLVPNNRCLVAVEGFYEWKKDGSRKQPYYIHFKDGRPLVFAALYDSWKNAEGETLYTFTILTTDSSSALQWLHDRMPVILGDEVSISMWLNGSSDTKFSTMLKPYEKLDLAWYPVTPAMGKPSFDGPECIKEIPLKTEQPISKFFSKKGAGNAKEPIKPVKTSMDSLTNTDEQKPIKEETETQVATKPVSFTAKEGADMKSDESTQLPLLDTKVQVKGDPEKRLHDLTPSTGDIGKTPITPIKKKAKVETGDDKQRTLRSYFGKS